MPSPYTVSGSPRIACARKFDTTRPSPGASRGPNVLKMRTILVSMPWVRWYAIVMASAKRLASSYTERGPTGFTLPQ